jgi:hypothetical protein
MSSASNGLAATGVKSGQSIGQSPGLMYSVRIVAVPAESVSCRRPAGIQSARDGGSTQVAASVLTVSTPLAAHAS